MGSPYSEDLRRRVLTSIDEGMSKSQAARTFQIARSTIDDWFALREQTGQLTANTHYTRGPRPALADTPEVHAFVQDQQHSTLAQMAQAWQQQTGETLSQTTFCSSLRRLGYTRKKRVTSTAKDEKKNANASPHR